MSNEHNENDKLVSETYRELASETTPVELDSKVLAAAAAGAKPRRSAFPMWMRPVAWAATAVLAVAIVFETTESPQFDLATPESTAPSPKSEIPSASGEAEIDEAFTAIDSDLLEEAEELARQRVGPNQRDEFRKAQDAPAENAATPRVEVESRSAKVKVQTDDVEAQTDASAAYFASAAAPTVEKKESGDAELCDEKARATASDWYACIVQSRDAGLTEEADQEMLALLEEFPDFQPNK